MSFGFSISDFYLLSKVSYKIYQELKEAPAACHAFAEELNELHIVLQKARELAWSRWDLDYSSRCDFKDFLWSCQRLLFADILGCVDKVTDIRDYDVRWSMMSTTMSLYNSKSWRTRWESKQFAKKIPKLQREISAHIEKLTFFMVVLTQSDQRDAKASQKRQEDSQAQLKNAIDDWQLDNKSVSTHLGAASDRVEQSQNRIEDQLQRILASQQRQESSILSQNLDASSPEGRETWMTLGRLLRAEGITPAMIKGNRNILIKAMKKSLEEELSASVPDSYHTACESLSALRPSLGAISLNLAKSSHRRRPEPSSFDIFGSAPPASTTFTSEFLDRQNLDNSRLSRQENISDGMQSLLVGMDADGTDIEYDEGDQDGVFGLTE